MRSECVKPDWRGSSQVARGLLQLRRLFRGEVTNSPLPLAESVRVPHSSVASACLERVGKYTPPSIGQPGLRRLRRNSAPLALGSFDGASESPCSPQFPRPTTQLECGSRCPQRRCLKWGLVLAAEDSGSHIVDPGDEPQFSFNPNLLDHGSEISREITPSYLWNQSLGEQSGGVHTH